MTCPSHDALTALLFLALRTFAFWIPLLLLWNELLMQFVDFHSAQSLLLRSPFPFLILLSSFFHPLQFFFLRALSAFTALPFPFASSLVLPSFPHSTSVPLPPLSSVPAPPSTSFPVPVAPSAAF